MSLRSLPTRTLLKSEERAVEKIKALLQEACAKVAPVWPLENFVAVNPYLGLTGERFDTAANELAAAGGIQMTLDAQFYVKKWEEGHIDNDVLKSVLQRYQGTVDVGSFLRRVRGYGSDRNTTPIIETVGVVMRNAGGKDWARFMMARVTSWAASYFDQGQAVWSASRKDLGPFAAWKVEASADRTPELTGLKGFRNYVKTLPENPLVAAQGALEALNIGDEALPAYLHSLAVRHGGWAAVAARIDWEGELYGHGGTGTKTAVEFLAILLCWEAGLLKCLDSEEFRRHWDKARRNMLAWVGNGETDPSLLDRIILQEALDLSYQRSLVARFESPAKGLGNMHSKTLAQCVFCIDVRSEVFRRHLESANPGIETMGFAGFFAFPVNYVPLGQEVGEAQCPVLLPSGPTVLETSEEPEGSDKARSKRILHRQVQQVWKGFRSGAVSCFSYVSPMGLAFLPKLITDSFGLTRPVPHPNEVGYGSSGDYRKGISLASGRAGDVVYGIPLETQIAMAKNALTAMSLTDDFAPFVLIVGHGSSMVNNPHATGYDCGACGGHTGEANAKVAAAVLNNTAVRAGLQREDIYIPVDTVFLACLHDTTTDKITIYNEDAVPADSLDALKEVREALAQAGNTARAERLLRFETEDKTMDEMDLIHRSRDWSQLRPEWGLAGCSAFVVAPRKRTLGMDLEGKSFLHSYDWKKDRDFGVLELIMTAPMVVTSWINLQYYGSVVDNKNHGSGNKTLHNVTSGIGVLEGYSGDLRVGLPFQALHDGEGYQHEPLRLQVIIEAPLEAMTRVLEKHDSVRDLCDNGWIYLLAMDENGRVSHRYAGDLSWEVI